MENTRGVAAAPSSRPALSVAQRVNRVLALPAVKPIAFALALLPLGWLVWGAVGNHLGANPAEAVIRSTGDWTLRLLCMTLAVTPLRTLTGWHALIRLRRMAGLYTFFYGVLHLLAFAWLDMGFEINAIVKDIGKRPFILVGTLALLTMLPLAATSFNRAVRGLGAARWQRLHRLVYATALLALLHFFWMRAAKRNFAEWSVYAAIVALLLGWRLWRRLRPRAARVATS